MQRHKTSAAPPPDLIWVHAAWALLLSLSLAVLYLPYLSNALVFDDLGFFSLDRLGQPAAAAHNWHWYGLRALPQYTLVWSLGQGTNSLLWLRLGSLVLHGLVSALVYLLVLELRSLRGGNTAAPDCILAGMVALFFSLHPVSVYAAGYLIQRSTLIATGFSLLAIWSYLRGAVCHDVRWVWLCALCYWQAVFAKEHALGLLLFLPLISVYLQPGGWAQWRLFGLPLLLMAAVAGMALLLRRDVLGDAYEAGAPMLAGSGGLDYLWWRSLTAQSALFFQYAALWLLPNTGWMSVDIRQALPPSAPSVYWLAPLAFVFCGVLALVLLRRRGRSGLLALAVLAPWLMFWSELATVRIQEPFVLYRSYLWAACSLSFAATLAPSRLALRQSVWPLALLIAAVLGGLSWERLGTFRHPLLLWDDAEKLVRGRDDLPGAARIYFNRANQWVAFQRWQEAIEDLHRAIQLQPEFPSAYKLLGVCYQNVGATYLQ